MRTDGCKRWEYKDHPDAALVQTACEEFAIKIRAKPSSQTSIFRDTKPYHHALFKGVVPRECVYVAGNYRGSEFECLRATNVGMGHHKGAHYSKVAAAMDQFHVDLAGLKTGLDHQRNRLTGEFFAVAMAQVVAMAVSQFQLIHPFMNGNGHVARLLAWVIMANYEMLPARWWMHENPGWDDLVSLHQDGQPRGLQDFILRTLAT